MTHPHLQALQKKHQTLEDKIHRETKHAARDEQAVRRLKGEKLHLKEEIDRLQRGAD